MTDRRNPTPKGAFDTISYGAEITTSDTFVMKLNPSAAVTNASSGADGGADCTL